eukprot:1131902-Alexandrium_andersonii.AAC.1
MGGRRQGREGQERSEANESQCLGAKPGQAVPSKPTPKARLLGLEPKWLRMSVSVCLRLSPSVS